MKNIKKYLLVVMTIMATSCTDWLDVQPTDTVSEDKMFEVSAGHRVALNGIYKLASNNSLYGEELTWGLISALGNDYDLGYGYDPISNTHPYFIIASNYVYTNSKAIALFDPIWQKSYACIVNCNNLIGKVKKEDPTIFREGAFEQNLIHGEALAMRAMMHFDVLRLFAPAPIKDDGKAYTPYYEQDGLSVGSEHLPVKTVLSKIVRDLKMAQDLVAPFDTLTTPRRNMLVTDRRFDFKYDDYIENKDMFFSCRGFRMNYTAITAILARVYNYMGEHKLAFDEAQKVISFKAQSNVFSFTTKSNVSTAMNLKTTEDLIMTLQSPLLYDNYLPHTTGTASVGYFTLSRDFMSLFDDPSDYRKTLLIGKGVRDKNVPLKNYKPVASGSTLAKISDMLPVIRLSEMYYITAEYYASIDDFLKSTEAIDAVRIGRDCTRGRISITDKNSFERELIKEMRREFVGEGQTYYYYKKMGVLINYGMKDEHFIFPKPIDETVQI